MAFRTLGVKLLALSALLLFAHRSPPKFEVKSFRGSEAKPYQERLSSFYSASYQAPPYRYFAKKSSWDNYVASYIGNSEAVIILALHHEEIVGAAVGTPLKDASEKYREPFAERPNDLNSLFYLGELAVKDEYRNRGVGKKIYVAFENEVREKERFKGICLWQLASQSNLATGKFWKRQGFKRDPELHFEEMWRESSDSDTPKVPHKMVFWKKGL